jgi:hypothetical protein
VTLFAFLLRIGLALVFFRSAALKLVDRTGFQNAVANYQLLPTRFVPYASTSVPILELAGGGLLVVGLETRVVSLSLAALLLIFALAVIVNLLRGREISCGCSGVAEVKISWWHVNGDFVLAGAAGVVARWAAQPLSVFPGVHDDRQSMFWTSQAIAVMMGMLLVVTGVVLAMEARKVWLMLRPLLPEPGGRL